MNEMLANRYALVKLIGEGGMASVYLAVDTILRREVAVKVLRGDLSNDKVSLVRFQREANAATKLSHPNIVEVYDVGEDHGKYFIVMEYVKGRTLKDLIQQRGALSKEEAVNIMCQLVSAVDTAHKNGIIHRDIKSQNVLIKDDGTVKLSDFGIALAADAVQLTQTDVIVGSVHYLAPELARGEMATQQSDIYALGIVFYEMLTGDVPHHGDAPVQIAIKHMREEIPSVRDFNPEIPQSVDNIIRKATVKNRKYRYPTASAMYEDLMTCLDESRKNEKIVEFPKEPGADPDGQPDEQEKESPIEKKKRKTMVTVIITIAAAIVALVLLVIFQGPKDTSVVVPNVKNLTIEEATELIEKSGLYVSDSVNYELTDDSIKAGNVSRTVPAIGATVDKQSFITLYISEANYYTMPDFKGRQLEQVEIILQDCCNLHIRTTKTNSSNVEAGTVLSQSIAPGTQINPIKMQEIVLEVATQPSFEIPTSVIGMNWMDAKTMLEGMGARVNAVSQKRPQTKTCTITKDPSQNNGSSEQPDNPSNEPSSEDENDENCTYTYDVGEDKIGTVFDVDPKPGSKYSSSSGVEITIYYYGE